MGAARGEGEAGGGGEGSGERSWEARGGGVRELGFGSGFHRII
jgi:hypothetical protein